MMDYNSKQELEAEHYIFDTCFLHSLLISEDVNHSLAKEIFKKLNTKAKFSIPFIVLAELAVAEDENHSILKNIKVLTNNIIFNSMEDLTYIGMIDIKTRKSLKANDCLIISTCKREKATLLTFDKKLYKFSSITKIATTKYL